MEVITAFGISRPAPIAAPTVPPTISPIGPPTSPPALAPFTAPAAVVDWANAALEASSDAASNETVRRFLIMSSSALLILVNDWKGGTFPVPLADPAMSDEVRFRRFGHVLPA